MQSEHPGTWQAGAAPPPQAPRIVVIYSQRQSGNPHGHESSSQNRIAERVAALLGFDYAGEYDASAQYDLPLYFVPRETVHGVAQAARLGLRSEQDLFGGVVPHAYVASKVITHPLPQAQCSAPEGWSHAFGERVGGVVLPGYSAFSVGDALAAGRELLAGGAVRIKLASGIGGSDQSVAASGQELERQIAALDPQQLREGGVVLERNLNRVVTHSVGQVRIGWQLASYCGIQHLTTNNAGGQVYGGSDLLVVAGGHGSLGTKTGDYVSAYALPAAGK